MQQAPGAGGGAPPPVSAPMSTPQPAEGEKQSAMTQVQMAIDLLEQTLPVLGTDSDEGQAVLSALGGLSKKFHSKREKGRELIPSELMNLIASQTRGSMQGAAPTMPPGAGAQPPGMPPGMPPG